MQIGSVVTFNYGGTTTLAAHGVIDGLREYRGMTYVHVTPIAWLYGNPLPQWKTALQVREVAAEMRKAS
jgi:hypothetical protein